jgi:PIN domain
MAKVVYLFPDTNVFVQCRPLEELDWTAWGKFDEVHLVVSRPVQAEIDNQKNKGGDRLARRARRASSILRRIILDGGGVHLIRAANPIVKIIIRIAIRPSLELNDVLDYNQHDDRLVGIVRSFLQQNPGADARVLTHDTGPMAAAQMVGVAIAPVPDEWLLPAEPSEADKKMRALEAEVQRLKQTEPQFLLECIDSNHETVDRLELEVIRHEALSDAQITMLVQRLKERFPRETNFGQREHAERPLIGPLRTMGIREVFTPATDGEIADYHAKYEQWLRDCSAKLRDLHITLNSQPKRPQFLFAIANVGTRPANDALVTLRATGQFKVLPPPYRSDHDSDRSGVSGLLSNPPEAPCGTWSTISPNPAWDTLLKRGNDILAASTRPAIEPGTLLRNLQPRPRDSNAFYYKPERPSAPVPEFSLECAQWRHGGDSKTFLGDVHFDIQSGELAGALECRIQAENLSEAKTMRIPLRIRINKAQPVAIAETIIDTLAG